MRQLIAQLTGEWSRDPLQAFLLGSAFGLGVGVFSCAVALTLVLRRERKG